MGRSKPKPPVILPLPVKKLGLLLLALAAGPACQMTCDSASCGCGTPSSAKPGYYDIEGVSLVGTRDAGSSTVVLTAGSSAPWNAVTLRLAPTTRYIAGRWSRGGGNLAWACSPVINFSEKLDSVTVHSRYAYNAQHPAGAPLNDLLAADSYNNVLLGAYLRARSGEPENMLGLRLAAPPAAAGPQQFVVRYRLTNGEVYTAETPVFTLQP